MSGTARAIISAGRSEPMRPWPRHALTPAQWSALADALALDRSIDLLALWADTRHVHALLTEGTELLPVSVAAEGGHYAAFSPHRPGAAWFERMIHDLWGHVADGARDLRPWLDHGHWEHAAPMALRPALSQAGTPATFLTAEGDDLHQIPVGPIHAGIIEPGHFRATAQGETLVRLEVRLGYTHKGVLTLMRGKPPRAAARFAARLSGDSTVAHAAAFARAVEAALDTAAPPRAVWLRAVMGEVERVANHLNDIGAIIADAAFAVLPARLHWHREQILQATEAAFGHRLMMDLVVPGGVAADLEPAGAAILRAALDAVGAELPALIRVYDDRSSLVDRMVGTGILSPVLAALHAAGGFVGRASGRAGDARLWPGYPPFDILPPATLVLTEGDVDARVRIRLAELADSLRLLPLLLDGLPEGRLTVSLPPGSGEGIGVAEGFRGDIWHWVRIDGGLVAAAFPRDPSWLHWPLLEAAVSGNIVADFPLCNRSFNASYSGVDL